MKPDRVRRWIAQIASGLVLALIVGSILVAPAVAECVDYGTYIHIVGSGAIDFTPVDMVASGSSIFVAAGPSGLEVVDITDPLAPRVIGQAPTTDNAVSIAVSEGLAYLGDWSAGLMIFDVQDPSAPGLVGSVDTPGGVVGVGVEGGLALLATDAGGLFVIDVANPAAPTIIGALALPENRRGLAVRLPYVYVVGDTRLDVIDVSEPTIPVVVGTAPLPAFSHRIALSGSRAYVAGGDAGVVVVDISDPIAPIVTGNAPTPDYVDEIHVSGGWLYAGVFTRGVYVFDISAPDFPALRGTYHLQYFSNTTMAVAGGLVYFSDYQEILVLDAAAPHPYDVLGETSIPDLYATKAVLDRNTAYVTTLDIGLYAVDISDPRTPSIVGVLRLPGHPLGADAVIRYGYAYLAYGDQTVVADVRDPAHPLDVRNLDMDGCQARAVALRGIYLYILDSCDRLWVADVSSPAQAQLLDHIWMSFHPLTRDLVLSGHYAYAAGPTIVILDLSNPVEPVVVGTAGPPAPVVAMAATDVYLYLLGDQDSFCVMDISDPLHPVRRGCVDLPHPVDDTHLSDFSLWGSYAYVADKGTGLQVVDISNPDSPRIVGAMTDVDNDYGATCVAAGQSSVCLLDKSLFKTLPLQCAPAVTPEPIEPSLSPALLAFPQPSRGETELRFSLPASGEAGIDLFDAAGRRVRTLYEGVTVPGMNRVPWDGKDDGGRAVGSGIYFVRLRWGDRTETSRLIIVR